MRSHHTWSRWCCSRGGIAPAHEIGTTRVSVLFRQGRTYEAMIVTDAAALAEKLERRRRPTQRLTERLRVDRFRRRVKIGFDTGESRPEIAFAVAAASGSGVAAATIRLNGATPAGAGRLPGATAGRLPRTP